MSQSRSREGVLHRLVGGDHPLRGSDGDVGPLRLGELKSASFVSSRVLAS